MTQKAFNGVFKGFLKYEHCGYEFVTEDVCVHKILKKNEQRTNLFSKTNRYAQKDIFFSPQMIYKQN